MKNMFYGLKSRTFITAGERSVACGYSKEAVGEAMSGSNERKQWGLPHCLLKKNHSQFSILN
jgi:hypothetical protein